MTREEAVEVLKERYLTCVGIGLDNHANRVNEAIDMAIEALQFADKSPRTVKLTEDIVITLDEEAYEIGYTRGQMADRPKGEWIESELDKGFRVCSVCKNKGYKDKMAWRTDFIKSYLNFCPNCGARMTPYKGGDTK